MKKMTEKIFKGNFCRRKHGAHEVFDISARSQKEKVTQMLPDCSRL